MVAHTEQIKADAKTVRELLDKVKYKIDFFQREYKWQLKQIDQLIEDLTERFSSKYDDSHERKVVRNYPKYFMGPIILSLNDNGRSIIDGQQRLTSITLLLIYLNNLQKGRTDKVEINDLIFSEKYSEKSFNVEIRDRRECIEGLYYNGDFDGHGKGESIENLSDRYRDIQDLFPSELKKRALPFFIDWLIDNVVFVEIKTYSDDDAYLIFETMNDRGLNLSPTEMLKGYLLSRITQEKRQELDDIWKTRIFLLKKNDKDEDLEFFRAWLRSKYAKTIRASKGGAENEDFEKISTRFHNWVRDNDENIGLETESDYLRFIKEEFNFYSDIYLKIVKASKTMEEDLEHIYYIHSLKFARSFYAPLLMSPVKMSDSQEVIRQKLALVGKFLETFVVYRRLNNRTTAYASIRYTMYSMMREIRGMNVSELAKSLKEKVQTFDENLEGMNDFSLNQQNRNFVQFLLARITSYIEKESGISTSFIKYFDRYASKPFEIEHIWANKFEMHKNDFDREEDFVDYRNRLGDLILVPNGFNQSYGDASYESKIRHYYGQNLLAQTLSNTCYEKNPSFRKFAKETRLVFKPYEHFTKDAIDERQRLYQKISERIWSVGGFDEILHNR